MKKYSVFIILIILLGIGVTIVFQEIQKPSVLVDKEINISYKNSYAFKFFNIFPGNYTVEMNLKLQSDIPLEIYDNSDRTSGYNGSIMVKLYQDEKLILNNTFDKTWISQHVGGGGGYIFYKLGEFTQNIRHDTCYLLAIDIENGDPRFLRMDPRITIVSDMSGYGLLPLVWWAYFLIIIIGIIIFIVLIYKSKKKGDERNNGDVS